MPDFKPMPKPVKLSKSKRVSEQSLGKTPPAKSPEPPPDDFRQNTVPLQRPERPRQERVAERERERERPPEYHERKGSGRGIGSHLPEVSILDQYKRSRKGSSPGRRSAPIPGRRRSRRNRHASPGQLILSLLMGTGGKVLGGVVATAIAVVIIYFIATNITTYNALAVYIGDELIGYVAFSEELEASFLQSQAVSRMEARENAQIQTFDVVTVQPAGRAGGEVLAQYEMMERLAAVMSFNIMGTAIEVGDTRVAILRSRAEAENALQQLQAPHLLNERIYYDYIGFLEDVRMVDLIIDDNDISTIEFVLHELRRYATVMEEYMVQEGDNLSAIAERHNTTLNQIYEDNTQITPATVLRVGDVITLRSSRPYLSVRTVETVSRTEPVPMTFDEVENPAEPRGFLRIIQEGEDGEREVDLRITRVNGIQTEPEVEVGSRVISEMVPQITEIGTR